MNVKSICGTILIAHNPEKLARFYGEVLGIEFQQENHGGIDIHYGTDIGEVHFGIHPASNFKKAKPGNASTVLAFNVSSISECVTRLARLGAEQVQEPHDEGFGLTTTYLDPEENFLELVELKHDFGKAES